MLAQQAILAEIGFIGQGTTQTQEETHLGKKETVGDIEKMDMLLMEVPVLIEGEGQVLKGPITMATGRNTHEGIARRFQVLGSLR